MRITVLLIFFIAGICDSGVAQKVYRVPNTQRYFVGIKGGVLTSWSVYRDPDLKNQFTGNPVPGFYVAGLINFSMKKNYSFQSEFGFSQMGRSVKFNSDSWSNTSTYHFLDFSMMLRHSFRLKIGKDIPANWYVNIGPNIKYWLNGTGKVEFPGSQNYTIEFNGTPKGEYDKLYYQDVNRWIFGLDFGLGANLGTLKGQQVMAELRFTYGQTYLGNKDSVTPASINLLGYEDSLLFNLKVVSFSLAYTLDFYKGQAKMGKSNFEKGQKKK